MTDTVSDPLIELLAIKLYEHDVAQTSSERRSWFQLSVEDRDVYRKIAHGEEPLDDEGSEQMGSAWDRVMRRRA